MIKRVVVTFVGVFLITTSYAQHYNDANGSTDLEGAPGYKQKKIGTTLTIGGGILLTAGAILVSQADEYYYNSTTTNGTTTQSGDPKGGLGVVMIAAGLGMGIPGVILWSKGAKKLNVYKEEHHLSMGPKGLGLSLRLNF